MKNCIKKCKTQKRQSAKCTAFALAEVTMAKRVSDKTCLQEFVRMSEPKAPTRTINRRCAFTLAEVTMAKRVSDKTCSQEFVRMSEPKAPTRTINKFCAFTLAEVLITLAIIGIVAALTIPAVVRNYKEKQTVVQLKKVYSQLSSAFQMARVNNGAIESWGKLDGEGIFQYFKPYMKVIKECGYEGCFADSTGNIHNNTRSKLAENFNYYKFILADGTNVYFRGWDDHCSTNRYKENSKHYNSACGFLTVDLNGFAKPNKFGEDTFEFYITKYGIVPSGVAEMAELWSISTYCNRNAETFEAGGGCTAWILAHENMDYLHKDVAW